MNRTVISVSDIRTFLSCRQKWQWHSRNGEHLRSRHPSKHLFLGSVVHEALAAYYKLQMLSNDTSKKTASMVTFAAFVNASANRREVIEKDLYGDMPPTIDEYTNLAHKMLQQYQRWAPSVDKFRVIDVEYELAVDYTYWLFIGFIDAIVQLPDGTYWLLEHKCVDGETEVNGVPLKDLWPEGDDGDGLRPTQDWTIPILSVHEAKDDEDSTYLVQAEADQIYRERCETVLDVEFRDGTHIKCTPNHPILLKGGEWIRADRVHPMSGYLCNAGERIPAPLSRKKGQDISDLGPADTEDREWHLAYLAGVFIAEGYGTDFGSTVHLSKYDLDQAHRWGLMAMQYADADGFTVRDYKTSKGASITGWKFRETMERETGIKFSWRHDTKKVPDKILRSPHHIRQAFLKGYWENDGHTERLSARASSTSYSLMRTMQSLLLSFGIQSSVCQHGVTPTNKKPYYQITVSGEDVDTLSNLLGLANWGVKRRKKQLNPIVSITEVPTSDGYVYDLANCKEKNFIATCGPNQFVCHNTLTREPDFYELFFSLQASGYMWAAQRDPVLSQLDIKGVIFNLLLKTEVKPPKVLKSGKLSKDKRQATSIEMYRKAIADNGLNPADYEQFILGIDPNRYNKRKKIVPTPAMIDWFDDTIRTVGMEMCKSPVIYPAQARECGWCDFKLLCTWVRNGLDWRSIVNAQFVKRSSPDAESLKELCQCLD